MKCPKCGHKFEDENQKYRRKRYEKGLCARCSNKRDDDKTYCKPCLIKQAEYNRSKRERSRNLQEVS